MWGWEREACILGEEGQEAQSSVVEADWDEEGSHGTKWAWHKLPGLAKHVSEEGQHNAGAWEGCEGFHAEAISL